jgi:hypothetical protein
VLFGWWRACAPPRGRLLRLQAACRGRLADVRLRWSDQAALTVVMAARGYPGSYARGGAIAGLDSISTAKASGTCDLVSTVTGTSHICTCHCWRTAWDGAPWAASAAVHGQSAGSAAPAR